MRIATLVSASRSSRSRIMRLVTLLPSRPAIGESLTAKRIDSVGGSIGCAAIGSLRSEEHTSELQSLMRISYAVFCLKKKTKPEDQLVYRTRTIQNKQRNMIKTALRKTPI